MVALSLSALAIVPGLISLVVYRLKPSVDFTGGTELQVSLGKTAAVDEVKAAFGETIAIDELSFLANGDVVIKAKPINNAAKGVAMTELKKTYPEAKEAKFETLGPTLGKELLVKTLIAMLLSASGITLYVAYRFSELKYGICAVLAMPMTR